jgi:hypothetical protein
MKKNKKSTSVHFNFLLSTCEVESTLAPFDVTSLVLYGDTSPKRTQLLLRLFVEKRKITTRRLRELFDERMIADE